jgi:fatty acid desaturase
MSTEQDPGTEHLDSAQPAGAQLVEFHERYHHGRSPAAWTCVTIIFVGFVIGGLALVFNNWPTFWIGGVGVIVLGAIIGKVMELMGYGQELRDSATS